MTDNEIIKALKCCSTEIVCDNCPYGGGCVDQGNLRNDMAKDALNLINRQKAENEDLKKVIETMTNDQIRFGFEAKNRIERTRAEAYKEIIEKLKEHLCNYDHPNYFYVRAVDENTIDEVLKEMVGD